jgi:hypothetical protein
VVNDFAKQMLTLVGTLMTAVIAFYFGTASMRAPNDISRAAPELSGVEPDPKLPTADPVTLTLRGFVGDPALATPGVWDVTVVDDIGRTATKKGGLPVKTATGQASPASPPVPKGISPLTAPKEYRRNTLLRAAVWMS